MLRTTYRLSSISFALLVALCAGLMASAANAQGKADEEIEEVELVTKDNVLIKANYYHGKDDKNTVPVILIHGLGGKRSDLDALAKSLQGKGNAVLVPDLRGHGDSTSVQGMPDMKLDYEKARPADFAAMALDLEACKKYFKDLNNNEKVNLENLTLVGAGPLASVLCFAYTAEDWRVRPFGRFKQGQDVKAVIMFSPTLREKTIQATGYMRDIAVTQEVSYFMIVNSKSTASEKDADRFEEALERSNKTKDDKERIVRLNVPTTLEGAKILEVQESPEILRQINVFIERRVKDKNFDWQERER